MKIDNGTPGNGIFDRTLHCTGIEHPEDPDLPNELKVTVAYQGPTSVKDGIVLDRFVVPYITAAVNEASKPLWIVVYHHRHGTDVYPFFQEEEPSQTQMIQFLDKITTYEGDRPEDCQPEGWDYDNDVDEDESVEAVGPWHFDPHSPGKRN